MLGILGGEGCAMVVVEGRERGWTREDESRREDDTVRVPASREGEMGHEGDREGDTMKEIEREIERKRERRGVTGTKNIFAEIDDRSIICKLWFNESIDQVIME